MSDFKDKDVIYVYKELEYSAERTAEYIKEKLEKWIEDDIQYQQIRESTEQNNKKSAFGKFKNFFDIRSESEKRYFDIAFNSGKDYSNAIYLEYKHELDWLPWKSYGSYLHDLLEDFRNKLDMIPNRGGIIFSSEIEEIKANPQKLTEQIKQYTEQFLPFYNETITKMKTEMKNALILTVDELKELQKKEEIILMNVKEIEPSQILIKHPFMPNSFMSIETSESELFHIKMQCLSRIMQCLGATKVSGHAYISETRKREIDAGGHISYKAVDTDFSINTTKAENYESDYILEDTFKGAFSEASYKEALEEAKRVGLYDDFDIKNLLEQRSPDKENSMQSRKVKIELTRELNKSLDAAFSLTAEGFKTDDHFKQILEISKKVMFELDIQF